jgi:L-alanine-DL-glutamate epimerase-like enolase superfamily enzyme
MLCGDVALEDGITPMLKIAHFTEAFRMKCEIHHGGNSLDDVANLQLKMAVPNYEYFEALQPDAAQKYGLVPDIEVVARDWSTLRRRQASGVRSIGSSSAAAKSPSPGNAKSRDVLRTKR